MYELIYAALVLVMLVGVYFLANGGNDELF